MNDLGSYNNIFSYAGQSGNGITVNIGANVTKIPAYLFGGSVSPKIATVKFANGSECESIGNYAFNGCSSLTSIEIPTSVLSIGAYAFYNCSRLTIYAEAESKPAGWDSNWNYSNRPVYYYSDTEINGRWHYVDGVPTLW
jgi:hypothetical protein